jgi:hypothetical protein
MFFAGTPADGGYTNPFFKNVAVPLKWAHQAWKGGGRKHAIKYLIDMPEKSDWRLAAVGWFSRRMAFAKEKA